MWPIYTRECYSAPSKREIMKFAGRLVDLGIWWVASLKVTGALRVSKRPCLTGIRHRGTPGALLAHTCMPMCVNHRSMRRHLVRFAEGWGDGSVRNLLQPNP